MLNNLGLNKENKISRMRKNGNISCTHFGTGLNKLQLSGSVFVSNSTVKMAGLEIAFSSTIETIMILIATTKPWIAPSTTIHQKKQHKNGNKRQKVFGTQYSKWWSIKRSNIMSFICWTAFFWDV